MNKMFTKRISQLLFAELLLMLSGLVECSASCLVSFSVPSFSPDNTLLRDSDEVEDNPFEIKTSINRVPVDSARLKGQQDYAKYIMDRRYQGAHEDVNRHWYDNMFITIGAGTMQIIPLSSNYQFNPITDVQLGVGVQLGKYHSLRVQGFCGLGYQQKYDRVYSRYGGRAEHLFDLSSFFEGYKPARLLGVSTIMGVGGQYARLNNMHGRYGTTAEFHGGLQFNFYTGPHGYLSLEPYFGIASDQLDLSLQQNWRRFDTFYGANLNYVYYFSNHLSRAARIRQIDAARNAGHQELVAYNTESDSVLQTWQTPWLLELAFGPNLNDNEKLGLAETMGANVSISVGKWFSPVIGIRGTLSSRSSTWVNEPVMVDDKNYTKHRNMRYVSGGMEAMLNPFGFSQNFSWDTPYGLYLVGGGEYGWLVKEQKGGTLHCRSEAYTAGIHLWAKLTEGIQVFIEPRIMHNVYKIPYTNAKWNHRFTDNSYSLRVGLTAQSVSKYFRKRTEGNSDNQLRSLTIGLGGGTSSMQSLCVLDEKHGASYNFHGYATYHLDKINGLRLGLEFMTLTANEKTIFTDYNMSASDIGYAPITRTGLWNHNYHLGTASLSYALNMGNLMGGGQSRQLFNVEAFFGPAIACLFGETGQLDESISLAKDHEARVDNQIETKTFFALNGGATLSARLSSRMALMLTHQLYWTPNLSLPAIQQSRPRFIETFDFGLQFEF
ncbi:hypothetical protein [uncultured Prevotella sp.]|uniref:hypothetical protein n=1 Tax=uncultured Prevotella sp. TaxID=159272 RepID=UPI00258BDEBA|nr:hypothetical protein [uncultured Prevotella sp.]